MGMFLSHLGGQWLEILTVSSFKTAILLALALLTVWRLASASVRHFILTVAVVGSVALPVVSAVLPRWEVAPVPRIDFLERGSVGAKKAEEPLNATHAAAAGKVETVRTTFTGSRWNWSQWLLLLWLAGAGFVGTRLAAGLAWTFWLGRTAPAIAPGDRRLLQLARACSLEAGLRRNIRLALSDRTRVPVISGWLRPAIILPARAGSWPDERLRAVLLHEMAHVRRRDVVSGLLAHAVSVVHWFNPLIWLVLRRMHVEREKACDDFVIAAGVRDIDYARHLLEIGRSLIGVRWFAPFEVALGRKLELEGRLMDILDKKRNRGILTRGKMLLVGLLSALVIVPLAGISGQADEVELDNVTPAEKTAILNMLTGFYDALREGEDYEYIRETFLTEDYFDQDDLTLEKLDRHVWREVFDNTLTIIRDRHAYGNLAARPVVTSIRRTGDEYVLTQETDIVSRGWKVREVVEDDDHITLIPQRDSLTGKPIAQERSLLNNLRHQVFLRKEDGRFKIARYDDGVSIMQMDTDNPYGPIFLVWVDDLGRAVTPYGPFITKIIPAEYMGDRHTNIEFEQ